MRLMTRMNLRSTATTLAAVSLLGALALSACGEPLGDGAAGVEVNSGELVIPGTSVGPGDPSGTIFNGEMYLAYTGSDKAIRIARRTNGTWTRFGVGEKSNDGATLASFNGWLYLVWIGTDTRLNYMRSWDGINFIDKVVANHSLFRNSPAAVPFSGDLHLVVNELRDLQWPYDDTHFLQHFAISPDHALHELERFGVESQAETLASPSAAALGPDQFVMVWEGLKGDGMYTKKWIRNVGWTNTTSVPRKMVQHVASANTSPPSLILVGRQDGNIGPRQITFERSTDGVSWQWLSTIGETTSARPYAVNTGPGFVDFAWAGTDGNHSLNVRTFGY